MKTSGDGNGKTGNGKTGNGRRKERLGDVGLASAAAIAMLLAPLPTIVVLAGAYAASRRQQKRK